MIGHQITDVRFTTLIMPHHLAVNHLQPVSAAVGRFLLLFFCITDADKTRLCHQCSVNKWGGKVICVPVALPASTLSNTPAEGNQRFHLRTVDAKIPYVVSFKVVKMLSFDLGWFSSHFRAPLYVSSSLCYNIHRVSKKNFSFLFCQNFVKFPPILISFGR